MSIITRHLCRWPSPSKSKMKDYGCNQRRSTSKWQVTGKTDNHNHQEQSVPSYEATVELGFFAFENQHWMWTKTNRIRSLLNVWVCDDIDWWGDNKSFKLCQSRAGRCLKGAVCQERAAGTFLNRIMHKARSLNYEPKSFDFIDWNKQNLVH